MSFGLSLCPSFSHYHSPFVAQPQILANKNTKTIKEKFETSLLKYKLLQRKICYDNNF